MPSKEKLCKGGMQKDTREGEREEKMKKLCGMTSTRERSDNKKAMRGRKEVTVAARHAEGQLCKMRCQQRRTRAEERNRGMGAGGRAGGCAKGATTGNRSTNTTSNLTLF